jgi:hypothetical protein
MCHARCDGSLSMKVFYRMVYFFEWSGRSSKSSSLQGSELKSGHSIRYECLAMIMFNISAFSGPLSSRILVKIYDLNSVKSGKKKFR